MNDTKGTRQRRLRVRSLALLSLLTALMFSASTWAQSQSTLLDRGIYAEDSLGDLDKAIELYEQILADAESNRIHAAQAQYRVGVCYAKKGLEKDAAAAFQKVVDQYPDGKDVVGLARDRLAKLIAGSKSKGDHAIDGTSYSLVMDDEKLLTELLWRNQVDAADARGVQFDFSPDGEQFVFRAPPEQGGPETNRGDWRNWGDWAHLFISDRTGTLVRSLFPDQGSAFRLIHGARWSPSGDLIAFAAIRADKLDGVSNREEAHRSPFGIFVIAPEGGMPRQVGPDFDTRFNGGVANIDLCWTPDGKALTRLDENGLHTFDLEGNEIRSIPMKTSISMKLGGYSPDGRWLAYNVKPENVGIGNISSYVHVDTWVLPATGGRAIRLTHEKGFDGQPTWSPDGNNIYFVSTRGGSPAPYGGTTNIWKLKFNSETGHADGAPEQVTFFSDATLMFPRMVDEGRKMAFSLFRTTNAIHVADDARPEESRVIARGRLPKLSANGQTVVYRGEGPGQDDLFAVPVDGGVPRRLTQNTPSQGFEISPDGSTVAFGYVRNDPGIFTVPVEGGERSVLVSSRTAGAPQWSPDGSLIAYTDEKGLYVVPAEGGEPREVAHLYDWDSWTVRWSPDGKYIAALGYADPQMHGVFVVPAEGGEPRMLTQEDNSYAEQLEWHPDGDRIAYTGQGTRIAYLDDRPTTLLVDRPNEYDFTGVWHPDGRRFFFSGMSRGPNAVWYHYIHDSDMENDEAALFEPGGIVQATAGLPSWSRDGKMITWVTDNVTRQVWLMENFR